MNRVSTGGEGAAFKFRVSLEGVDADTATLGNSNFQIHEKMRPMAADRIGTINVPPGQATATVNIGTGYAKSPSQILIKDSTGLMGGFVSAKYNATTGDLTFSNLDSATQTASYAVLIDY